ncbi:MAG TPA: hypothetical protein VNX01_13150, partial [Bacteroidia bacterium]|nr:hypothetical protein [Bacteroidia bacterium]
MKKRGTKFKTKLIAFLLFLSFCGFGTSKYWVASSASNWNNTANWSLSSGGVNGAAVPGSGDVAIFDGGSLANCSIDATVNVAGFNVTSSYTGLISQNSFKITIGASNAVFSGGTFSGGTNSININGTFTISGTAFTSTSGSFNIKNPGTNPIVFSSGSFSHNNGSVTLTTNGTSNNYSISGSFIFNNLTLLGTFNTFSFTSPNIINGNFSLNASIGGTTVALNSMTVNGTTTLSGNNAIILSSGTLFANGDIITSFTGDPYSTGTGVINISGIGNQTMNTSSPAGQGILSNITINKSSGTLTLIGNISLFGTWNYIQGVVDAISNASTVIFPEGNSSILNGQGTSSAMTFYNVTVNLASAVTVTLGGNLIISNNLTLNNSSGSTILDATTNGYNISIGGSFVGQSNTSFLQRNSTVILNGSTTQILQLGTNTSGGLQNGFYNLTINNTGGGAQLLANNFFVTNNLILTTGNINLNNLTLTLGINSTTGTGSLTQTNGWLYGGTFTRWLATSSIIVPSTTGLFPMGSASDYCPFWLGSSTNLTSGGTVSVNFNPYSISNPGQPTTSVPIDSIPGHIPTQAGIGIVDGTWPNGSGGFLSYYGLTNS